MTSSKDPEIQHITKINLDSLKLCLFKIHIFKFLVLYYAAKVVRSCQTVKKNKQNKFQFFKKELS